MVFDAAKELIRQELLSDDKFFRSPVYYFELLVPAAASATKTTSYIFPLALNPQSLTMSEPFTVSESQTQGGGLYVEENGIIARTIKMKGTTGFEPKPYRGDGFASIKTNPSYGRNVADKMSVPDGVRKFSGQRHFQFLQDVVFRKYADLKKDPSTAAETKMVFHNPKDDEHWVVIPKNFSTTKKTTYYEYDIELLAVAPAQGSEFKSEEKGLIDTIKDKTRMIQSGVNLARSGIRDITRLVNEIEGIVNGFSATIANTIGILDDAAALLDGTASFIASPFELVANTLNTLESSLTTLVNSAISVPDPVTNAIRNIETGLHRLSLFPEAFRTDSQRSLESAKRGSELSLSKDRVDLTSAASEDPPASFDAFRKTGTGLTPGDLLKADSELGIGRGLNQYQSASDYVVTGGDSLQNIASRFLGDARLWRHIAILNNLKHPFISASGIPGTVRIGDRIQIPSFAPPPKQQVLTPVIGVSPEASGEEKLLGTDLALSRVSSDNLFDIEIDEEGGAIDVKTSTGVENLTQGLLFRLGTEKGTDQLYRSLGVDRIIAVNDPQVDRDIITFRVIQAVGQDPRIVSVRNVRLQSDLDVLKIELDGEVVAFNDAIPLSFEV
jgi:hypothetical protein